MLARFDLRNRSPPYTQARHWLLMEIRTQFIAICAQQNTMDQRDGSSLLGTPPNIDLLLLPASFEFQQRSIRWPVQYSLERAIHGISYRFRTKYKSHGRSP